MARKSPAARRRADQITFDDDAYDNVRFSATFDYNELTLDRAAELLAPGVHRAVQGAEVAMLLCIVGVAVLFGTETTTAPIVGLGIVAVVLLFVANRWADLQVRYARSGSLAPVDGSERMHVVICDDVVHVQSDKRPVENYDLADLRVVYDNSDYLVAGFGGRDYVYVPRVALSENRYRELARFLHERCDA
ncbi:hypothetical protein [Thermophilibacter sp.]